MNKYIYLLLVFATVSIAESKAQVYTAKVSKDSLGILTDRVEALKASLKIHDLKIDEAKEEAEVEKLRIKLLEANEKAKQSAAKSSDHTKKLGSEQVDAKEIEKLAKKAKNDMQSAQKALERYNKQIADVEKLRSKIQEEERKAGYKKPIVLFGYN
jgi:chromosome segregation ATPase